MWDVVYRITDDGERLRRIRCHVLGRHVEQCSSETQPRDDGGLDLRLTGTTECAICHVPMGVVDADFQISFPDLFEWH